MNTQLSPQEFNQLDTYLLSHTAMDTSMVDGYLAAVASGPNFVMPDQILRVVRANVKDNGKPDIDALILRHYQHVNSTLNDQVYVPQMTDTHAWCRGYLAGFSADMIAWEPLLAAQPGLLKSIMCGASKATLTDVARCIHAFWVGQRRLAWNTDGLLEQLAALSSACSAPPDQRLH